MGKYKNPDPYSSDLMLFTRDFPGWHLDEIFDYMSAATPKDVLITQFEIVKHNEDKKMKAELEKKQKEQQETDEPFRPRIRTRNWKKNENNRNVSEEADAQS